MISTSLTNPKADTRSPSAVNAAASAGCADLEAADFHPLNKLERLKSGINRSPEAPRELPVALTMGLLFCGMPAVSGAGTPIPNNNARLVWDASSSAVEDTLAGRPGTNTVYVGTQSGIYPIRLKVGREAVGVTITNLVPGCTYFFAVDYSNETGKSLPSNEVEGNVSATAQPPVGTPPQRAIRAVMEFSFSLNSTHPISLSIYRSQDGRIIVTCRGRPHDIFELQQARHVPTLQNQHTAWSKIMQGQINENGIWWTSLPVETGDSFFRTVNYGPQHSAALAKPASDERGAERLMAMTKALRFPVASNPGEPPLPGSGAFPEFILNRVGRRPG